MTARRPLATDDFARGLYRMDKAEALGKRHVQVNSPYLLRSLVFDVDQDDAARAVQSLAYDAETIPEPSWITVNPHTEHAHVGYLIAEPITRSNAARRRPVEYAADIQRTLTARMGADRAYANVVTRNPLHRGHVTTWGPSKPYSLGELHAPLGKLDPRPSKLIREAGLGRNVALFDNVRAFAYREWKRHECYDTFYRAVHAKAVGVNVGSFDAPLSPTEARTVARSVASWTWGTFNRQTFSEIQRNRSMRRASVTDRANVVKALRSAADQGNKLTAAQVMDLYDVSLRTARSYISEAGLTEDKRMDDRTAEVAALRAQGLSYARITERTGLSTSQVRYALRKAQAA
jgi:hypothetical protein